MTDEFRSQLLGVLHEDVARACAGSTIDPVKAALEVMRSLRPLMPDVVGPGARFSADAQPGLFTVESPAVNGSRRLADILLDARAPGADLRRDTNPLLRRDGGRRHDQRARERGSGHRATVCHRRPGDHQVPLPRG
ncbi:hypothetical protein [Kutzneria sp. NPDC051319]|uniref:hypothetical protein n=1 Tax=Kutzneria sp. NPDC051319 TaxID=3155047 RepID=UPI00342A2F85